MKTGVCTYWKFTWGLIKDDVTEESHFVHFSELLMDGHKELQVGDYVEYDLGPGNDDKLMCVGVTKI